MTSYERIFEQLIFIRQRLDKFVSTWDFQNRSVDVVSLITEEMTAGASRLSRHKRPCNLQSDAEHPYAQTPDVYFMWSRKKRASIKVSLWTEEAKKQFWCRNFLVIYGVLRWTGGFVPPGV